MDIKTISCGPRQAIEQVIQIPSMVKVVSGDFISILMRLAAMLGG